MSFTLSRLLLPLFANVACVQATVSYTPIADTQAIVTGVRADSPGTVVLTANYTLNGVLYAGLYQGSLADAATAPSSSWHALTPSIAVDPLQPTGATQTVTSATFYGPNTARFDPNLGDGNIVAVGSYKYTAGSPGPKADHGMLYQGPVSGGGTWKQIDATPLATGPGEALKNTIAHSTMGNLVVGNYDTTLTTGKAFIYNRTTGRWTNLNPGGTASVTAYGIWQNGGSTGTSYTIAGGISAVHSGSLDQSYLVDYDSATGALNHYTTFNYNNTAGSAALVHFDGITATSAGFNLTGIVTINGTLSGFFASVARKPDGNFGEPVWTPISYPGSKATTGNTIVDNQVLGIFITSAGTQSYTATVPATLKTSTDATP